MALRPAACDVFCRPLKLFVLVFIFFDSGQLCLSFKVSLQWERAKGIFAPHIFSSFNKHKFLCDNATCFSVDRSRASQRAPKNCYGRRKFVSVTVPITSVVAISAISIIPPTSTALSPMEAEVQYNKYASTYDRLSGGRASSTLGIDEARTALISKARGHVLEIGVGTGLNLEKYIGAQLSSLTLIDISEGMLQEAATKIAHLPNLKGVPVKFVKADATSELVKTFAGANESGLFDTVIDSFSLCVMGNEGARKCLNQISGVVKMSRDGGQILLLENCRSSNPLLGLYQDATADIIASAGGKGCLYNQDVRTLIASTASLQIETETLYAAGLFRKYECIRVN